ncbi:MAG: class I SAM-dependent methyltransferase [Okeania sp. SIO3B3]|nr:class I SAM-dependent methyltransferase [Okeania sp. SIO3B3]
MKCKICEAEAIHLSTSKVLNKYDVNYFQCKNCGFVQTEAPYWLEEAYSSPIANSDTGLVMRNIVFSKLVSKVIFSIFNTDAEFLDYGCGYGLFVRIMRSIGLNFYGYDRFCENIFAKEFEVNEKVGNYELITAFEVFEHLIEPCSDIKNILKFSRNILFSTELLPANNPKPREWYYYAPHEGQHISIYTVDSLSLIAKKFNLNYYTNGKSIHLFTEKKLHPSLSSTLDFNRYEPVNMVQEMRTTLLPSNIVFDRHFIYDYNERGKTQDSI